MPFFLVTPAVAPFLAVSLRKTMVGFKSWALSVHLVLVVGALIQGVIPTVGGGSAGG